MIVQIICHVLTSVKFREILQQYQNSMEKGKFRDSTQNSTARKKLWALRIRTAGYCYCSVICLSVCLSRTKRTRLQV